ncbi:hypothetical protein HYPSUDRAFT_209936 [Hypholoma sublateritium FD-334 SS-4]|uniref:Uncharacterized protein n=1 Tax=Hypholoma sublateritium (strain FD-334 SS-4) TaxID=945553 RepID=A0A0D2LQ77_HYPSF|nr:hypothetical protein HYPSUDRAFT_209936 [Hypholoma sublateritium FD-334 SS-4]
MDGTEVNIESDGSVNFVMDPFYDERGRLYRKEIKRIIDSGKEHNFFSHKDLVLYHFNDDDTAVDFHSQPKQPKAWSVIKTASKTASNEADCEKRWEVVLTGLRPGVFERSGNEWLIADALAARNYYKTVEEATAAFSSAVQRGDVIRRQRIVTRDVLERRDRYIGHTTDREVLDNTTQWHIVTIGRQPGVFSSEPRFEMESTHSNVGGIDGGTITVYSTVKLAVQGFSAALNARMVERVSVVHIREVMIGNDYPGLVEAWRF